METTYQTCLSKQLSVQLLHSCPKSMQDMPNYVKPALHNAKETGLHTTIVTYAVQGQYGTDYSLRH